MSMQFVLSVSVILVFLATSLAAAQESNVSVNVTDIKQQTLDAASRATEYVCWGELLCR